MVQAHVRVLACLLLALEGTLLLKTAVQCLGSLAHPLQEVGIFPWGVRDRQELLPFPPCLLLLQIAGNPLHPQLRSGVRVM